MYHTVIVSLSPGNLFPGFILLLGWVPLSSSQHLEAVTILLPAVTADCGIIEVYVGDRGGAGMEEGQEEEEIEK